jgi:hypothetical protein
MADGGPGEQPEVAAESPTWEDIGLYRDLETRDIAALVATAKDVYAALIRGQPQPFEKHGDTLLINGRTYTRRFGRLTGKDIHAEFAEAAKNKSAIGTSGRTVFIGKLCVFKNAFDGSFALDAVIQEASRNLTCISMGINHALCYGIIEVPLTKKGGAGGGGNHYFFMEELLDIDRTEWLYLACWDFLYNMTARCSVFPRALTDPDPAIFLERSTRAYMKFMSEVSGLIESLQKKNIGGDFKLDNIGFGHGENVLLFSDLLFPSAADPYKPKSWAEWKTAAVAEAGGEAGMIQYLNPFLRLGYWVQTPRVMDHLRILIAEVKAGAREQLCVNTEWDIEAVPKGGAAGGHGGGKKTKTRKLKKRKH